jgi:hypothetical protein
VKINWNAWGNAILNDVKVAFESELSGGVDGAALELSRQLHAAGAPDAPLEQQFAALLADHIAMRETGEEMPSVDGMRERVMQRHGFYSVEVRRGIVETLDETRPIFAKRTRERDEGRALVADRERAVAAAVDVMKSFQAEAHAQRERAERAERELAASGEEGDDLEDESIALRLENATLRARITELESRRVEPSADMVEKAAAAIREANRAVGVSTLDVEKHQARAVLSALAEMGEDADVRAIRAALRWDGHGEGDTCAHAYCVEQAPCDSGDQCQEPDLPPCDAKTCFAKAVEEGRAALSRLAPVIAALRVELDAKGKRVAELEAGLREVVGEFKDALPYVPVYFREKWGYDSTVEKATALAGGAHPAMAGGEKP